jgi:hypothetical protein
MLFDAADIIWLVFGVLWVSTSIVSCRLYSGRFWAANTSLQIGAIAVAIVYVYPSSSIGHELGNMLLHMARQTDLFALVYTRFRNVRRLHACVFVLWVYTYTCGVVLFIPHVTDRLVAEALLVLTFVLVAQVCARVQTEKHPGAGCNYMHAFRVVIPVSRVFIVLISETNGPFSGLYLTPIQTVALVGVISQVALLGVVAAEGMPYCFTPPDTQPNVYMSPSSAAEFVCEPFSIESSMHIQGKTDRVCSLENTHVNQDHNQQVPLSNGLCATRSLPDIKKLATFFQPGVQYTVPFDTEGT